MKTSSCFEVAKSRASMRCRAVAGAQPLKCTLRPTAFCSAPAATRVGVKHQQLRLNAAAADVVDTTAEDVFEADTRLPVTVRFRRARCKARRHVYRTTTCTFMLVACAGPSSPCLASSAERLAICSHFRCLVFWAPSCPPRAAVIQSPSYHGQLASVSGAALWQHALVACMRVGLPQPTRAALCLPEQPWPS